MKKTTFISSKLTGVYPYNILVLIATMLIMLAGCTKNFEKMNTDPTGITKSQLQPDFNNIGLYYPGIQQHIFGEEGDYQLTQNLNADSYSGYYMSPDPFRGNINNQSYSLVDGWNSDIYSMAYGNVMGPINTLARLDTRTESPHFWAIALILQVQAMSRVTDDYGPIPYSKVGQASTTPYDAQKDVYNLFFAQLDTAVTNLKAYIAAFPGAKPFAKFDMVYAGDYTQWLKYANSLRLRLAMHIVNADPATAKTQALSAINNSGGLITTNTDNAQLSGYGYHNPIWWVGTSWTDLACGASLTSYLNGYKDPRLSKYCYPAGTFAAAPASITGQYVGIRAGTPVGGKPMYSGYSTPNFDVLQQYTPMILMNAAEVWFLKAEAALRGWTSESAQTDYETGITTSMSQWGVSAGNYLSDNTSTQASYVDPLTPTAGVANASINAMSTITIAWDPSATKERNLERIITQKWIAMYPSGGVEAWTEYRRTGYPRLFPVVVNNSGGTISTDLQIRRIQYPSSEYTNNKDGVTGGVSLLGGPDNGGTPVWWDTNKGKANPVNF
jgi:hypothetical protein